MKYIYLSLILLFTGCFGEKTASLKKKKGGRFPASYNFGGSCVSKGAWVNDALNASRDLKNAINQLRNQEGCESLINVLQNFPVESRVPELQEKKDGGLQDLNALANSAIVSNGNGVIVNTLFGKTLDNVYNRIEYYKENSTPADSSQYGLNLLNGFLSELPNHQRCLYNNPNTLQTIATSAIRMASAYTGGDILLTGGVDQTLTNLISVFREKRFSNALTRIDNSEFFLSLSCIVESVTESYCKAVDAKSMLNYLKQNENDITREGNNPFEGYLVLTRDTDIVSRWLLKVMFGVEPKLLQDAQYKNTILDNVTEFLQDVNNLKAQLNSFKIDLDAQQDQGKKTFLLNTVIKTISDTLIGGFQRQNRGDVNFFQWTGVTPEYMPYYLIGRSEIPREAVTSQDNPSPMSFDQYVQFMGTGNREDRRWLTEFDDPDALFETIRARVAQITELAEAQARSYFRKRFIIDIPNLSSEAITDTRVTVKQSLINVRRYLRRTYAIYREKAMDPNNKLDIEILPFIAKTISSIDNIVSAFEKLQDLTRQIVNIQNSYEPNDPRIEEEIERLAESEEITAQYDTIIDTVYDEFNILLQRDTFLQTRVETMVKFEYADKVRNMEDLDKFQKYAFVLAGQEIISTTLNTSYTINPLEIEQQLNSAMLVHENNLRALEELFSDSYMGVIRHMKGAANGERFHTIEAFLKDSLNPTLGLYEPVGNLLLYPERYFLENFSYRKPQFLDDFWGSLEQFSNRLCIQSLAFKNKTKFAPLCMGSVLSSPNRNAYLDNEPLEERYDRLMLNYIQHLRAYLNNRDNELARRRVLNVQNRDHVCAFRNMLRRNHVFNLLREFEDARGEGN
jgi:hypothetical protein